MKKVLIIGAVILLAVVLLTVVFAPDQEQNPANTELSEYNFLDSTESNNESDLIVAFARECMRWYVDEYLQGKVWLDLVNDSKMSECFSDDYITNFPNIVDTTGADPVLNSQSLFSSWEKPILAKLEYKDSEIAQVQLQVGENEETFTYMVELVKDRESSWLISYIYN